MATTISIKGDDGNLNYEFLSDEENFIKYQSLIEEVQATGHVVSAEGAIAYEKSDLKFLEKKKLFYEERVYLFRGGITGRNSAS